MLIIVSRDHGDLYRSLQPAQEANGRDRVILDRRIAERRRADAPWAGPDRRRAERRAPVSPAERALMRVLGFAVVHPEERAALADPRGGEVWGPAASAQPPAPRRTRAPAARRRSAAG
jgi:hypothetical protein